MKQGNHKDVKNLTRWNSLTTLNLFNQPKMLSFPQNNLLLKIS